MTTEYFITYKENGLTNYRTTDGWTVNMRTAKTWKSISGAQKCLKKLLENNQANEDCIVIKL